MWKNSLPFKSHIHTLAQASLHKVPRNWLIGRCPEENYLTEDGVALHDDKAPAAMSLLFGYGHNDA